MDFSADLDVLFSDFAEDGVIVGRAVRGIFSVGSDLAALGPSGLQAVSDATTYLLPTASLPVGAQGAELVLTRGTYYVARIEQHTPDTSLLVLEVA